MQVTELRLQAENAAAEKEYYYIKLRDLEDLCQSEEWRGQPVRALQGSARCSCYLYLPEPITEPGQRCVSLAQALCHWGWPCPVRHAWLCVASSCCGTASCAGNLLMDRLLRCQATDPWGCAPPAAAGAAHPQCAVRGGPSSSRGGCGSGKGLPCQRRVCATGRLGHAWGGAGNQS